MEKEKGVVTYEAKDGIEVTLTFETIKKYLVQGHPEWVTPQEMMYFIGICKSRGLNPFAKDCYLIKYSQGEGAAIITSIDYYRKRAKVQKDCKGWAKGIIVERKGEIVDSNGLLLKEDTLLGAWFMAQPEGWENPFRLEINLDGYIKKKKDGSITKFWKKEHQPSQIAKVVESQGLRTLWPDEFQQLYTPEEIGDADMFETTAKVVKQEPDRKSPKEDIYKTQDVTPPEEQTEKEPDEPAAKEEDVHDPGPKVPEDPISKFKGLKPRPFKILLNKQIEEIPKMSQEHQDAIKVLWDGHFSGQPFPFVLASDKAPADKNSEKTEESPIMLNCKRTYEEVPAKREDGKVTADHCENECNPEWRGSCVSYDKYQENIGQ